MRMCAAVNFDGGLSAGPTSSEAKCAKVYCDMHKLNGLSFELMPSDVDTKL